MGKSTMTFSGDKELKAKLRALGEKLGGEILMDAVTAGAAPIERAAKSKAGHVSGLLGESITTHTGKDKKNPYGVFAYVGTYEDDYKGDTFYAAFVEYGHLAGDRRLPDREQVKPHPFLRPAFDENVPVALDIMRGIIAHGLYAAAGRAG